MRRWEPQKAGNIDRASRRRRSGNQSEAVLPLRLGSASIGQLSLLHRVPRMTTAILEDKIQAFDVEDVEYLAISDWAIHQRVGRSHSL